MTAIIDERGGLSCFGANAFGQCGVGEYSEVVANPRPVAFAEGDARITKVALGFRHGLALGDDGAV